MWLYGYIYIIVRTRPQVEKEPYTHRDYMARCDYHHKHMYLRHLDIAYDRRQFSHVHPIELVVKYLRYIPWYMYKKRRAQIQKRMIRYTY